MKWTLNPEQKLRKLGSHFMIVDSCSGAANIANVYVLNASAAWLWEQVGGKVFDAALLVELLCANYNVEHDRAAADIDHLIALWRKYHLINEI